MRHRVSVLAAMILCFAPLRAIAACDAPVYREFDFWLGNWRVTDARGKLLGFDTGHETPGRLRDL